MCLFLTKKENRKNKPETKETSYLQEVGGYKRVMGVGTE